MTASDRCAELAMANTARRALEADGDSMTCHMDTESFSEVIAVQFPVAARAWRGSGGVDDCISRVMYGVE